ncbi:unnamed protein product [Brassica oleracea]
MIVAREVFGGSDDSSSSRVSMWRWCLSFLGALKLQLWLICGSRPGHFGYRFGSGISGFG